eukprot:TRINITY_DN6779_c0_g2_i1.p1 TRINITY_DN6779_c0_g2~~TRINITY_DN6779_c0_g2_i1.p1  ORF type:complete len:212 (+),score=8.75 TRINITY_DN6779_c0_g2_i1:114-749(+)
MAFLTFCDNYLLAVGSVLLQRGVDQQPRKAFFLPSCPMHSPYTHGTLSCSTLLPLSVEKFLTIPHFNALLPPFLVEFVIPSSFGWQSSDRLVCRCWPPQVGTGSRSEKIRTYNYKVCSSFLPARRPGHVGTGSVWVLGSLGEAYGAMDRGTSNARVSFTWRISGLVTIWTCEGCRVRRGQSAGSFDPGDTFHPGKRLPCGGDTFQDPAQAR